MTRCYLYVIATQLLLCISFTSRAASQTDTTVVETKITMDDPDDFVQAPHNTVRNPVTGMSRATVEGGAGFNAVITANDTTFVPRALIKTTFSRKGAFALSYELPKRNASIRYEQSVDRLETTIANANMPLVAATDSIHYSGFSFYIPSGYGLVNNWLLFHQWHQASPESPPISFSMAPGYFSRLTVKILYGANKASTSAIDLVRFNDVCNCQDKFIDLPRDKWIDFVVRWKFDPFGTNGEVIVWKHEIDEADATKIFEYHGTIGFTNVVNTGINEKIGIYRHPDYVSSHKIIYDEVRRGKSFDAVKPW